MKCWKVISCVVVVVAGCLNLARLAVADEKAALRSAAKNVKQIVAHRGSSADRPECTLASLLRAIESGSTATEVDVRTTKDGRLVILHDTTVDRTTGGKGRISDLTFAEVRKLDAGSWFDAKYKNERIPTLREILETAKGKTGVLLDLKESGEEYAAKVIREVRRYGEPKRIIVGVRSVEQAKRFRKLLPEAKQLGLIPNPESIEAFAAVKVKTIRLWPRWVAADESLVARVRKVKCGLHINGATGTREEVVPKLKYRPESTSSDDPARLVATLRSLGRD
jgi:glycerophosphoryl diester phosphodiesterase